jgi:hypothetical protein
VAKLRAARLALLLFPAGVFVCLCVYSFTAVCRIVFISKCRELILAATCAVCILNKLLTLGEENI